MKKTYLLLTAVICFNLFTFNVNASDLSNQATVPEGIEDNLPSNRQIYEKVKEITDSKGIEILDMDNDSDLIQQEEVEDYIPDKTVEEIRPMTDDIAQDLQALFPNTYSLKEFKSMGNYKYVDLTHQNWYLYSQNINFGDASVIQLDVRIRVPSPYVLTVQNLGNDYLYATHTEYGSTSPLGGGGALVVSPDEQNMLKFPNMFNGDIGTLWILRTNSDIPSSINVLYTLYHEKFLNSDVGSWTPMPSGPDPDGDNFTITKIVYLDKQQAYAFYQATCNDSLLRVRDNILSLSLDGALTYLGTKFEFAKQMAECVLDVLEYLPDDFTKLSTIEKQQILEAGGGEVTDPNGVVHMKNGIAVYSTITKSPGIGGFPVDVFMNTYQPHTDSFISGAQGYVGQFDPYDYKVMFRGAF